MEIFEIILIWFVGFAAFFIIFSFSSWLKNKIKHFDAFY